jgi:hypothetical protein
MMLDTLIALFAIFGAAFIIKEGSIFATPRSWLMQRSSFFAALFYCYYCVGMYAGIFVFLLHWLHIDLLLWGLAGTAICGIGSAVLDRLNTYKEVDNDQKER